MLRFYQNTIIKAGLQSDRCLALPSFSCVILDKLFNLSEPQFYHRKLGLLTSHYLTGKTLWKNNAHKKASPRKPSLDGSYYHYNHPEHFKTSFDFITVTQTVPFLREIRDPEYICACLNILVWNASDICLYPLWEKSHQWFSLPPN